METTQLILEIILIIIGLYLAFFKSYFNEKGKNVATKEDISEITEMIETVKNQIYYNTQSKLSLKSEERNALVNYYEKFNYWLNSILDVYFAGINEKNEEKLKDIENRMDDAKFNYELAEGRMKLFVKNEELTNLLEDIRIKTIELQHSTERTINDLEYLFFEIKKMKTTTPIEKQVDEYRGLLEKQAAIMAMFRDEKLEKYMKVAPLNKNLQSIIYNHIQNLLEEK